MGWIARSGADFMDLDSVRGIQIYKPGSIEKPYKQGDFFIEFGLNGWDQDCNVNFSESGSNCCKDWLTLWYDDGNGGALSGKHHIIDYTNDFVIENVDDGECIYRTPLDENNRPAYPLHGRALSEDNNYAVQNFFDIGSYQDDGTPQIFNFVTQECGKYSTATTTNGHKIKYFGDDGTEDNGSTTGKTLATGTIHDNSFLREIYVPFRYTIIENGAFYNNINLTAVTFAGVEKVGTSTAFYDDDPSVYPTDAAAESLPNGPFYGCPKMTYVDFMRTCPVNENVECDIVSNKLKIIGDKAFMPSPIQRASLIKGIKCTTSTTYIDLSGAENLEYIGYKAFYGNKLTSIVIPKKVARIAPNAFGRTTSPMGIMSVIFETTTDYEANHTKGLTIYHDAFKGFGTNAVTIKNSVRINLGSSNAFYGDGSETTIPINVKLDAWGGSGTIPEWVTWYKNHAQWKKFNLIDRNNNPI